MDDQETNNNDTVSITVPEDRVEIYLLLEEAMNTGDIVKAKKLAQDCVSIAVNTYQRRPENLDKDSKEYLDLDQGIKAYSKILDTGITAQEALEYVAECYGKDTEWVEEVKKNNYLHATEVFYAHNDHKVQKAMKKDGSLRPKSLKDNPTPNHQLRELHEQRKLHQTLNELKEDSSKLKRDNTKLEANVIHIQTDLDKVKNDLNIGGLCDKEVAAKLKKAGIPQKVIADHLGINIRTVKRWWNDI